ncbi:protein NLRC3-like isoform X2 [Astatotilapia calliptera]|uniref:B30.2/SPRY domain-containing protein n=1 Tax=Astatotilapia calliptera TaxID=8154 RepID=A0AAX7SQM1_ASTCA|nr:protein NLRC3-like isoform X2 [Astatotilapia calliptera]
MSLCENKVELPPPSKATLCGDEITKAQSPEKQHRPHTAHREPEPNCMSVMSDQSNERYIDFQQGAQETKIRQRKQSPKPELVCVSTMSSSSNERYIDFKQAPVETSCVSMMSDQSNERHIDFKQGSQDTKKHRRKKSPKPEPVCVSTMSSSSNERYIDFSRDTENSQNLPANEGWLSFIKNWIMDAIVNLLQRLFVKQLQQIPASSEPDSSAPTTCDESVLHNSSDELDSVNEAFDEESTEAPSDQPAQQHQSHPDSVFIFMLLEDNIITFVKNELKKIQKVLFPDNSESQMEEEMLLGGEGEEHKNREALVKLALHFLRKMEQNGMADYLQNKLFAPQCQRKLKSNLKKKSQCVFEGIAKAGNPTLLNQIYTELYITEGGTAEVNNEHEVRQLTTASRKPDRSETTIRREDIFKKSPGRDEPIRTVLTKGVAGIGKTVLIQKFTLDWAEEQANQDIQFTFPFTFRELNVLKEKKFSLVGLVHHFFTETKKAGIYWFEHFQVVFILDGLDECRLPLDFHRSETLTDITQSASVGVLLTNLIRGKLLPSAHVWITTRPAAASQIPPEFVQMVTEVRGFTDEQKEEYFRKRFRDEEQASRIISHIKSSRSLHIMCHIPVFCWITATVLENMLKTREGGILPKTLTEMYIYFLVVQSKVRKIKYDGGAETDCHWGPESKKMIESLGKLAFDQLEKGNLIFYESDLTECGIDIRAASVCSGVFTQIFKEEKGLYQNPVFCFIHLSVQEFLAALHVHLAFINSGVSVLPEEQTASQTSETPKNKIVKTDFYQRAVDNALQSPNGHLDLFLRFLLGLSLQSNQDLLKGLQTQTESSSETNQKTVQYIKMKISENLSAEKSINLFHCLNELNDRSLVEEIQQSLSSRTLSVDKLSTAQWSALVFILLSSENDLDEFVLKKYSASEQALLRLLPVIKASKKAILTDCNLSKTSCEALTSVLSNPVSSLLELDLSNNILQNSGVKALSVELGSPHWKLETLRLSVCNLSEKSCEALSPALSCQSSSLRELDLNNNNLKDTGVKALSTGLESQHCKLETLRLSGCLITKDGCASLASALNSNTSHLKVLDLSYNHPEDAGVELQTGVKDQRWKLENLRVEPAGAEWLKPGLKKYLSKLTVNTNTINKNLKLSMNNMKVTHTRNNFIYPDHADRFVDWCQLLCKDVLHGRCYWEVEWTGEVDISVSYRGIARKGERKNCRFGENPQSWSLDCSNARGYTVYHNQRISVIHPSSSLSRSCGPKRVAVYVDCPAGTLSFYNVSSDSLIHLHTFNTTFTEPLYPGFGVWHHSCGSSVRLCSVQVEVSPSVR